MSARQSIVAHDRLHISLRHASKRRMHIPTCQLLRRLQRGLQQQLCHRGVNPRPSCHCRQRAGRAQAEAPAHCLSQLPAVQVGLLLPQLRLGDEGAAQPIQWEQAEGRY